MSDRECRWADDDYDGNKANIINRLKVKPMNVGMSDRLWTTAHLVPEPGSHTVRAPRVSRSVSLTAPVAAWRQAEGMIHSVGVSRLHSLNRLCTAVVAGCLMQCSHSRRHTHHTHPPTAVYNDNTNNHYDSLTVMTMKLMLSSDDNSTHKTHVTNTATRLR